MSDRSDSDVRLPRAAEALLARWSVTDKDERAWEESAEAILVRVEMARPGATDDALLAPPLPSEMGEGSIQSARGTPRSKRSSAPTSAPVSLAALARAALAEEQAASSAESARVSPLPASVTPLPASVTPLPAPVIESSPVSALPPVAALPPATTTPAASLPSAQLPAAPRAKRSKIVPLFAAGIAVIGMAAAAVLVIRDQKKSETAVAAVPMPAVDHEPTPAAAPPPPAAATTTDLEIETPESLAPAKPGAAAPAPRPLAAKAAAPPVEDQAGKVQTPEQPAEPMAANPPPAAQQEQDSDKMKPAAQPTDLPLQPSSGAVQAAVAQVIGSARACVAGHDEASRASIVFGSDGRVQSVAVSGPAAGTPAEACIRSALSRARVAPFAKPTFSVGTTIRP